MKKNNLGSLLFSLAIIVLFTLLITGCIPSDKRTDQTPIKIAINQWPGYASAFIAQEKGFFEKNGVKVNLIFDKEYRDSQEKYKNKEVDGVFEVLSDTIFHNAEGQSSKIVFVTDYSDSGDVIIGRKEFDSLTDLKDKKIGIDRINSFSHLFVLTALEKAGVKEDEFQTENVPAKDVLEKLERGEIDAGHTWEPIKTLALNKGYKQLAKAGDTPGVIIDVLTFNSKIVNEKPNDIRAIVKSLLEAQEFVENNYEESIKIMADKEEMSIEQMGSGIKGVHKLKLDEILNAMKKNGPLHTFGESNSEFFINRGQLSKKINLNEIMMPEFLEQINPTNQSQAYSQSLAGKYIADGNEISEKIGKTITSELKRLKPR